MRRPEESLNEFTVPAADKAAKPPTAVSLHFGGEVEVLKPLGSPEGDAIPDPDPATGNPFRGPARNRFSWFQSAVAAAAVLGIMVVVLLSAIFIGISDPSAAPMVATVETAEYADAAVVDQTPPDESFNTATLGAENSAMANDEIVVIRPTLKRTRARRVRFAAYRTRRHIPRPQYVVTEFTPTTLIIYPENGEIKSRIEPQVAAVYKKPSSISN